MQEASSGVGIKEVGVKGAVVQDRGPEMFRGRLFGQHRALLPVRFGRAVIGNALGPAVGSAYPGHEQIGGGASRFVIIQRQRYGCGAFGCTPSSHPLSACPVCSLSRPLCPPGGRQWGAALKGFERV